MCQILTSKGYRVLVGSHGVVALLLLEQHHQPIDLIITDVIMPFMSGKEFADKATDKSKDLKVLFMSGYTDEAILPTGVLLLEKLSDLLGQPLQIGKGGLREGVILDLLNGSINGSTERVAA